MQPMAVRAGRGEDGDRAAGVLLAYRASLAKANSLPAQAAEALTPRHLARAHRLRLCQVHGLATAYPRVAPALVGQLAVAGYGVYRSLLAAEGLFEAGQAEALTELMQHQNTVNATLSAVFGDESPMREWQQRWADLSALWKSRQANPAEFDLVQQRQLVTAKAALLSIGIDWLERLQPQPLRAARLRDALAGVQGGLYLVDALRDFEARAKAGLRDPVQDRAASLLRERGIDPRSLDAAELRRRFYASGGAEAMLADAMVELRTAAEHARLSACDWLERVVDSFMRRGEMLAEGIRRHRQSLRQDPGGVQQAAAGTAPAAGNVVTVEQARRTRQPLRAAGPEARDYQLEKLAFQAVGPGAWVAATEAGGRIEVDEAMYRVLRALNGRSSYAKAFDAYRWTGGELGMEAFRARAAQALELVAGSRKGGKDASMVSWLGRGLGLGRMLRPRPRPQPH